MTFLLSFAYLIWWLANSCDVVDSKSIGRINFVFMLIFRRNRLYQNYKRLQNFDAFCFVFKVSSYVVALLCIASLALGCRSEQLLE